MYCIYIQSNDTFSRCIHAQIFRIVVISCAREEEEKKMLTERTVFTSAYSTQNQLLCIPHVLCTWYHLRDGPNKNIEHKSVFATLSLRVCRSTECASFLFKCSCISCARRREKHLTSSLLYVCVRAVVHSLLCSLARSFSLFLHFSVFFACSLSLLPSRSLYRSTSLFLSLFVMHPPKLTMAGIRHARNSNTTANRCQSVHIHVCYAS